VYPSKPLLGQPLHVLVRPHDHLEGREPDSGQRTIYGIKPTRAVRGRTERRAGMSPRA
jgi:hypothetical protein